MIEPSTIEDAIIARLKAEIAYLKTVDVLAALLSDESPDFTLLAPAAFVTYGGGPYKRVGSSSKFDRDMKFNIVIVQRNFNGQRRLLHGDGAKKGVYDVLKDVRIALTDQALGLAIWPFTPIDDQPLEATRDVVVWGFSFHTRARG